MSGPALIDYGRLLNVAEVEGELLVATAHGGQPDALVPECPGLTLGDTVRHVGSVYRAVLSWIREQDRPEHWQRAPAQGQSREDYFRAGLDELARELRSHDPDEHCETWWPADKSYGFWRRRVAHETTIHRTDVERAARLPEREIADDVAVDGIDEVLQLWLGYRLGRIGVSGNRSGTVAVRTEGHRWLVRTEPWATAVWRAEAEEPSEGEVSAAPMDLYLWLWGRRGNQAVRIDGDVDAVLHVWALLRLATR
ncbi:MAG: maleylpyruvate isomerase family mycothiol-dependent enzyme [Pseudonocardiaceae bacterium]|nr:maleylpyruvate isomerase family mycothiol-dependent enzyme [Pseudonocardiaceae bacterium]